MEGKSFPYTDEGPGLQFKFRGSLGHWQVGDPGQPAILLPNGQLPPGFVLTVSFPSQLHTIMSQHQLSQGYLGLLSPCPRGSDPVARKLIPVSFPRDCVDLFTSITSMNTAKNRQTCGLLLGKDNGWRYTVTTLLIPKQHAASNICQCAIDEEELVMLFKEERSLITLGWVCRHLCWWDRAQCSLLPYCQIHTHITESCLCFVEMLGRTMT